jgi:hypothetical protein
MRNYRKEYDNYHSRPEQKIRRAARNAARKLFADADPDKDVHHKDNNPLNNDKKNLSLVTQHYNRKEPRIREKKLKLALQKEDAAAAADLKAKQAAEVDALKSKQEGEVEALKAKHEREGERQKKQDDSEAESEKARDAREDVKEATTLVVGNEVSALEMVAKKFEEILRKSDFKKKQKLASTVGIKLSKRGKSFQIEDMGTTTGPHISGTGDDNSTVVVKKKKKVKVYKRESLKKRIIDNVLAIQQEV